MSSDPIAAYTQESLGSVEAERRARRFWSSFVIGLLTMSVLMWGGVVYLAVSDASTAVVPDYHERALRWDEYAAIQRKSAELGWVIQPVVQVYFDASRSTRSATGVNARKVELFVRDREGKPVAACSGKIRMYHRARGNDVLESALTEAESGTYWADLPIQRSGVWNVEAILDRENEHFEWTGEMNVQLP